MKILKFSILCCFMAMFHANNIYTSQLREEKDSSQDYSASAVTTCILNLGKWEENKIDTILTIFLKKCQNKEKPLLLTIVTQSDRQKIYYGDTAKVYISSGEVFLEKGLYELYANKVSLIKK